MISANSSDIFYFSVKLTQICIPIVKKAILKKGKEIAILRKHPWIFSGAIESMDPCSAGELIEIQDSKGNFCAIGHVGTGSITIRIITFIQEEIDQEFWNRRLNACKGVRDDLNLHPHKTTNTFRLIHGEGDGLPGLIVDVYGSVAVMQAHSDGMFLALPLISQAIQNAYGKDISTIYSKSKASMHDESIEDTYYLGNQAEIVSSENGMLFNVNWETGQKTGFFIDQRENRQLLRTYSKGKSVLNTFAYTGGFSIAALHGGATKVISVDISKTATDLCTINAALNQLEDKHESITADVMEYLQLQDEMFDVVVLDPPAFAKSLKKKHAATMGYKRLNMLGLKRVKPGGLLFTFSCSQVIDETLFLNTVTAAAIESGRNCRILHRLSQGPDHPVNIFHPEGHYLKGLVLRVD
jgi:23S rRNA (cytosine1962-C5)-methyltransferase